MSDDTSITMEDLRVVSRWLNNNMSERIVRTPTESELLSLFTDEALVGELVKRGVLVEQANEFGRPFRLFAVGEPVGSVGETPVSYRYEVVDGVKVPRLVGKLPVNPPDEETP